MQPEIFEEYFFNLVPVMLVVCTNNQMLFMDNRKRDKIFLRVQYEDLIYIMGKKQLLKMSMVMRKKLGTNQQTDVRVNFIGLGARALAEDVLAYCQISILERSLCNQEYVDVVKKSSLISSIFVDEDDEDGQKAKNFNIIVTDDLLLGKVDLRKPQKELSKKDFNLYGQNLREEISYHESDNDEVDMNQSVLDSLTPQQELERKVSKQSSLLFKFRQKNFFVYAKKHPVYNLAVDPNISKKETPKANPPIIETLPQSKPILGRSSMLQEVRGLKNDPNFKQIDEEESDEPSNISDNSDSRVD